MNKDWEDMSDSVIRPPVSRGHVADHVHIRLFQAETLFLPAGQWNAQNVRSPFWRLYRNRHESAFLVLPTGSRYELCAHRVHFVPAGVSFSCGSTCDFEHFYIHFDVLGMSTLTAAVLFDGPITLPADDDFEHRLDLMSDRIRQANRPLDLGGRCWAKSLVYEGMARYLGSLSPDHWERGIRAAELGEPVAPALRLIEENLGGTLHIAELAASCCLSPDHFGRRFRECLGQTPVAFITHRRVTVASQRLLFTSDSLDKIATDCGFGSRFYLSRVFSRETGISPAAYRKSARV
jgi:AraC-like DNA-binding protein